MARPYDEWQTCDVDTSALIALVAIAIDKALAELEQQK